MMCKKRRRVMLLLILMMLMVVMMMMMMMMRRRRRRRRVMMMIMIVRGRRRKKRMVMMIKKHILCYPSQRNIDLIKRREKNHFQSTMTPLISVNPRGNVYPMLGLSSSLLSSCRAFLISSQPRWSILCWTSSSFFSFQAMDNGELWR